MSHPLQQGWGRHRAPRALPRARRSQGLPKLRLQRKGVGHGRGNEDASREKEKSWHSKDWDIPCFCTNSPEPLQDPAGRFLLSPPGKAKRRAGEHDPGAGAGRGRRGPCPARARLQRAGADPLTFAPFSPFSPTGPGSPKKPWKGTTRMDEAQREHQEPKHSCRASKEHQCGAGDGDPHECPNPRRK